MPPMKTPATRNSGEEPSLRSIHCPISKKRTMETANWRPAPAKELTLMGSGGMESGVVGGSLFIPGRNLGACDFFHKGTGLWKTEGMPNKCIDRKCWNCRKLRVTWLLLDRLVVDKFTAVLL